MTPISALWFDGRHAAAHSVAVGVEGDVLRVVAPDATFEVPTAALRWLWSADDPRPTVGLPSGGQLTFESPRAAASLPIAAVDGGWVDRSARSTPVAAASVGLMLLVVAVTLTWMVPRGAESLAPRFPWRAEAALGGEVLRTLFAGYLAPTQLSQAERQRLKVRFTALANRAGLAGTQFVFAQGTGLGANAIALPGRVIVVTDQLVDALGESTQLDAVVAHELGHLHHRHALRAMLREAGFSAVMGAVVQDQGLQKAFVEALPKVLLRTAHSRDAERQADEFAVLLLSKSGRSGADLAAALEAMQALRPEGDGRSQYLDTHPATSERINAARGQRQVTNPP